MPDKQEGTSIEIRPDAISLDHRTAFSYGPVALQDTSEGLIVKAWRIRIEVNDLILEEDVGGAWGNSSILFTFADGSLVDELSLAFNQNAEAAFAAEIGGQVYIYRFDALGNQWIFESHGVGRNPRLLLDLPNDALNSDLHLFYFSPVLNALVFRTQRENYQTERMLAPLAEDNYLEKALPSTGYRLRLIISQRDVEAGQYSITNLYSHLLPVAAKELLDIEGIAVNAELKRLITPHEAFDEVGELSGVPVSASLYELTIEVTPEDSATISGIVQGAALILMEIQVTSEDEMSIAGSPLAGELNRIVIAYEEPEDSATIQGVVQDASLTVV